MKITNSKEKKVMAIISSRYPLFFALIMAVVMLLSVANARADYTILHNFGADSGDGREPWGSLIVSGSTLYGMTTYGGIYGQGTLFKMNTDGSGYTILHNFGDSGDGYNPLGGPILSGSTLYGMTASGGSNGGGVLFRYTLSAAAPSTPAEVINAVDTMLASGGITSTAVANVIISQLSNAQNNLTTNPTSAANMISAVINFIEAQSGKKITTESAETLIKYLTGIIAGL